MEATRNHAFFLTSFITIQGRVYQLKSFKDLSTTSPLHDQDQSSQYKLIKDFSSTRFWAPSSVRDVILISLFFCSCFLVSPHTLTQLLQRINFRLLKKPHLASFIITSR